MRADPVLAKHYTTAKTLYLQGIPAPEIAKQLGCNRSTLESRFSRDNLPAMRREALKDGRGERTKQKIAEIGENITDELSKKTAKSAEGLNLQADTLSKVVKALAPIHGWGDTSALAVVFAGDLAGKPESEAIDVDSSSLPAITESAQDQE